MPSECCLWKTAKDNAAGEYWSRSNDTQSLERRTAGSQLVATGVNSTLAAASRGNSLVAQLAHLHITDLGRGARVRAASLLSGLAAGGGTDGRGAGRLQLAHLHVTDLAARGSL